MIDLDLLLKPVSAADPCGPDLDLEGDLDYLNFFASAESLLPMSYFEVKDADGNSKRFDPNSINLGEQTEAIKPLLARTLDLRLMVFLAKISILGRDLPGFTAALAAIAALLEQHWTDVHPRGDGGDFSHRLYTIEGLDVLPTVVMPLQFHPLLNSRRYGWISYRTCLIAKGDITAREDDLIVDASALAQIFDTVDLDQVKAVTSDFTELMALLKRIVRVWGENGASRLSLDRLSATVAGIAELLGGVVRRRDPQAAAAVEDVAPGSEAAQADDGTAGAALPGLKVTSMAAAAGALAAVVHYFVRSEPSSPALLLVCQAQQILGKSFVEALRILVPNHVEGAAINVGKDRFFDLPVERMAGLLEGMPAQEWAATEDPELALVVNNRSQALALLEQVGAYFRNVEPSSPVPLLIDRARELAQRDFLSLLRDILPEGALRTPDNQS